MEVIANRKFIILPDEIRDLVVAWHPIIFPPFSSKSLINFEYNSSL